MKPRRRAGKQRFAEGADVENAAAAVDALERGERAAAEAEFAVVIVLDDPGTGALCRAQQGETALDAHDVAERLLVRRRDERQAKLRRAAQALGDLHSLRVHRHRDEARAGGEQAVARADGAGILEPDRVAGIEQHGADVQEGLLRAADDEDLVRVAGDAAIGAKMRGDGLAQPCFAHRGAVAHHRLARLAPMTGGKARPLRHREGVERRQAGDEGAGRRAAGAAVPRGWKGLPQRRARAGASGRKRARAGSRSGARGRARR